MRACGHYGKLNAERFQPLHALAGPFGYLTLVVEECAVQVGCNKPGLLDLLQELIGIVMHICSVIALQLVHKLHRILSAGDLLAWHAKGSVSLYKKILINACHNFQHSVIRVTCGEMNIFAEFPARSTRSSYRKKVL